MPLPPPRPPRSHTARALTFVAAVLLAVAAALDERAARLATADRRLRDHRRPVAIAVGLCCLLASGAADIPSGQRPSPPLSIAAAESTALGPFATEEPTTAAPSKAAENDPTT